MVEFFFNTFNNINGVVGWKKMVNIINFSVDIVNNFVEIFGIFLVVFVLDVIGGPHIW